MARFTHPNDADIAGPAGPKGDKGDTGDTGQQGPQGEPGAAGGYYGSWFDTFTQTINTTSVGQAVLIREQDIANGFSVVNNSKMKAAHSGVYNFAFSLQLHNEGGGGNGQIVEIWLVKNGNQVLDTNTRVAVNTNSPYVVAAWNFFQQLNANDEIEIYWATDNHHIVIKSNTGSMGGPSIPSAIITVNQVG